MDETTKIQLAIDVLMAVGCFVGYRVESARLPLAEAALPAIEAMKVVGPGDWIALGTSQGDLRRLPQQLTVVSVGFELEGARGRVKVPAGISLRLLGTQGARRNPLDGTLQQGNQELTYELPLGATVWLDVNHEALHAFEGAVPKGARALTLADDEPKVKAGTNQAFPGCWVMILGLFGGTSAITSLAGQHGAAWLLIGFGAAFMLFGWIALPDGSATAKPDGG